MRERLWSRLSSVMITPLGSGGDEGGEKEKRLTRGGARSELKEDWRARGERGVVSRFPRDSWGIRRELLGFRDETIRDNPTQVRPLNGWVQRKETLEE
jgi:hypothetical protein